MWYDAASATVRLIRVAVAKTGSKVGVVVKRGAGGKFMGSVGGHTIGQREGQVIGGTVARLSTAYPKIGKKIGYVGVDKYSGPDIGHFAETRGVGKKEVIEFNAHSVAKGARSLRQRQRSGELSVGTLKGVATHEFGHAVYHLMPMRVVNAWEKRDLSSASSKYGASSHGEHFAEAFAEYHHGKDTPAARALSTMLRGAGLGADPQFAPRGRVGSKAGFVVHK